MPPKVRKSINNSKTICAVCKTPILESDEDSIECDVCKKTLHSICTELNKREYDALVNDHSLEYKCHFCAPKKNVSVGKDLAEIKTQLNQLAEIKETIQFMASQYDTILKGLTKNTKQIKILKKENDTLREEVSNLKSTVKYLNDCRVQNDIIINGINVDNKMTAVEVVLDVAAKTGVDICEDEVEEAYFLNRSKQNDKQDGKEKEKTKSLVVKFTNKKSKQNFMHEKPKMKEIEGLKKVFINDFLCKETLELLNYAKTLRSVGFKYVFAKTGNVFVKKDDKSRQIRLKSVDDVDDMLRKSAGGVRRRNLMAAFDNDEDEDVQFESPN